MTPFLRPQYRSLKPYTPGEQINANFIKLNTNESPFPPSPKVAEVLKSGIADRLRLYPDPTLGQLHRGVAQQYGLNEAGVIAGNGSDDVLAFAIMAYAGGGGKLVCPDITYGFYPVYADFFGAELATVPLREDFTINPEDYAGAGGTVVIANPNAPTGILLPLAEIEQIIATNPDNIVIIDEAYMDFAGQEHSAVSLLGKYDNLIVTRTLSKSHSLAGLRCGFALASKEIIADLNRLRYSFNPYNLSAITIAAASAAIADTEYYA
ncbi:MAG: aminotransferase class I/II-fold pyridoxal phosphate-dependent enzyme, partial [Oscillospiraceae bacterium]|nr:aminotransferase class I/II-fold pyridoxal phosphate-dependent enzyme [Oscillospiraceae bacterium]